MARRSGDAGWWRVEFALGFWHPAQSSAQVNSTVEI
jgi:hypothetical protein